MKTISLGFVFIALLFSTSCIQPQPPTATYLKHEIVSIDLQKVKILFYLSVRNPNPFNIDNAQYSYVFKVDNHELLSEKQIPLKLPADSTVETVIPVTLYYDKVFETTAAMLQKVLLGQKEVPYTLSGAFRFSALSLSIDVPYSTSGVIPLPTI